jgi:hypothetical protein
MRLEQSLSSRKQKEDDLLEELAADKAQIARADKKIQFTLYEVRNEKRRDL